jgi:hypothetical protein
MSCGILHATAVPTGIYSWCLLKKITRKDQPAGFQLAGPGTHLHSPSSGPCLLRDEISRMLQEVATTLDHLVRHMHLDGEK